MFAYLVATQGEIIHFDNQSTSTHRRLRRRQDPRKMSRQMDPDETDSDARSRELDPSIGAFARVLRVIGISETDKATDRFANSVNMLSPSLSRPLISPARWSCCSVKSFLLSRPALIAVPCER